MRQRLNWIAAHGLLRGTARLAARLGDVQSRLVADPMVMANPAPFCDELRAIGPVVSSYGTHLVVSHAIAHELLRSEDFEVVSLGSNLPAPMRWLERRTRTIRPICCCRRRCWPLSRRITRAIARQCPRCSRRKQ